MRRLTTTQVQTTVYASSKSSRAPPSIAGSGDPHARARIEMRIRRLSLGNPGDVQPIGDGLSEMRIDYGPGYRVYYLQQGFVVVVLLCGGDKRTKQDDIAMAKRLAAEWRG
ncbi:MAG: type II toxin-antitoxin system RelE/ParE family toxin [Intrasporangiaceae bacterium]|nr:type II toxin-antitoxin system RelE/ParE family toxin [Intrasporangiaceae bacterium]